MDSLNAGAFALWASMLTLGVVHGLGPDHCLAIAALSSEGRRGDVLKAAARFGAGHALVLLAFSSVAWLTGAVLSPELERAGELANGTLLVVFGAALVFDRLGGILFPAHPHAHPHGEAPHAHQPRGALAAGAIFAVSGIRSAALALPVAFEGRRAVAVLALVSFGLGVVLSMALYGLLLGVAKSYAGRTGFTERGMRKALGALTAAFGCVWLALA